MEEWVDIIGFEGCYKINRLGEVLSCAMVRSNGNGSYLQKQIVLRPYGKQYLRVALNRDGKRHETSIHSLLAIHFIPNPHNKPIINHKNGIKKDNSLENIEWATCAENNQHAHDTGLKIGANRKMVVQIDLSGNTVMAHKSILGASKTTGIGRRNIKRNIRGERPTAGGFVWKFIDR